jgi:hypothetical protein
MRNTYKIGVGNAEGKRLHERPNCGWENIIKMFLNNYGVRVWTGFN